MHIRCGINGTRPSATTKADCWNSQGTICGKDRRYSKCCGFTNETMSLLSNDLHTRRICWTSILIYSSRNWWIYNNQAIKTLWFINYITTYYSIYFIQAKYCLLCAIRQIKVWRFQEMSKSTWLKLLANHDIWWLRLYFLVWHCAGNENIFTV